MLTERDKWNGERREQKRREQIENGERRDIIEMI